MPARRSSEASPKNDASAPSKPVRVACRLNNGLVIEAFERVVEPDTGMPRHWPIGRATLPGTRSIRDSSVVPVGSGGEFTVTEVPRPVWEKWLKDNAENSLVVNGVVYALDDEDR